MSSMGRYRCALLAIAACGLMMVRAGICGDVLVLPPDANPGSTISSVASSSASPGGEDLNYLHLARGSFDPQHEEEFFRKIRTPGRLGLQGPDKTAPYYLLQFAGAVQDAWKISLMKQGVRFYGYVPRDAFLVKWEGDAAALKAGNPFVRALVPYRPYYKLAAPVLDDLKRAELGGKSLRLVTTGRHEPGIQLAPAPSFFLPSADYVVLCYPDADPAPVEGRIIAAGGQVLERTRSEFKTKLKVRMNPGALETVALIPEVNWIEPAPKWKLYNEKAGAEGVMDVHPVWQSLGLFGAGQVVGVADTGLDQGSMDPAQLHDDFENGSGGSRVIALFDLVGDGASDPSGHGTHVAGSVLGNGARSGSTPSSHTYPATCHAGMAPEASLVFQAHMDNATGKLSGLPADLNTLFAQAAGAGAKLHTDSWGSDSRGAYSSNSQEVDEYAWNNKDFTILFAAGNSGSDYEDPAGVVDEFSLGEPGTAKNCITVGASENNRPDTGNLNPYGTLWPDDFSYEPITSDPISDNVNGVVAFSGRGPCRDGRYKPDIVAPGTNILSVRSAVAPDEHFWATFNADYAFMGGTSMATPLTCGLTTLLREYLQKIAGQADPSSALIKAVLLNGAVEMSPGQYGTGSAREIPHSAPNDVEGWGRANLAGALPAGSRSLFLVDNKQGLTTGNHVDYSFQASSDTPLRVKLVWSDYPGNPLAGGGLVNNLDLSLIKPDLSVVKPLYPRSPGYVQSLDNAEGIDTFFRPETQGDAFVTKFVPNHLPFHMLNLSFMMAAEAPGDYYIDLDLLSDNGGVPGDAVAGLSGMTVSITNQVQDLYIGTADVSATGIDFNGPFYVSVKWAYSLDPYLAASTQNPVTGNDFHYHATGDNTTAWENDATDDLAISVLGKSTESTSSDDAVNNVEGIEILSPSTGTYTVRVTAQNVAQGPQPYAVAILGNVSTGTEPTPTVTPTITPTATPTATPSSSPPGDVNLDGSVTPADAQMAFDFFLGTQSLSTEQQQKADFCSPGSGVTPGDAQGIFNAYLGLSNPCQ